LLSSTVFSKKSMGLGLGFVAAGAVKELVVVVGHIPGIFMGARAVKEMVVGVLWWLGWRRTWLLSWVWVGVRGLGCCHGWGGCMARGGGELVIAVDVGGCWGSSGKKKSFFNNILIECNVKYILGCEMNYKNG
jgi:hypothetical protein